MKKATRAYIVIILLLFSFNSCSQPVRTPGSKSITVEDLKKHMEYFASDELEGRKTGTAGYLKAAEYAAEQFKSMGLEPGWTDEDGSKTYFQPVPFTRYIQGKDNSITLRKNGEEEVFRIGGNNYQLQFLGPFGKEKLEGKPVFIGYGIHEPEYEWDDFKGLDIDGKIVIMMAGAPVKKNGNRILPNDVHNKYADREKGEINKLPYLIEKKPGGVIFIGSQEMMRYWDIIKNNRKRFDFEPDESYINEDLPAESPYPVIIAHQDFVRKIFTDFGFDPVTKEGNYRTFEFENLEIRLSIDYKKEKFTSPNVIGILRGSNEELKDEYITAGAHLDHLGREGNIIYNGANDNATGSTVILEIAEAAVMNPPARPVIFILYTAEEAGHIGSRHFLKYPPVPRENIKLNINVEQIGSKTRNVRHFWAVGAPELREPLYKANEKTINARIEYSNTESMLDAFRGSDNYSYYRLGIPAMVIGTGFPEHHTPRDNLDIIDYDYLYKGTKLVYAYLIELGNR
ncbi:M20/M25/M40 family metallo-hydrolase [candidate division KSB1 bacterium]